MVKAKVYILDKHFEGEPKESDLKLVEEELLPLKDGEFLAEAVYFSMDPYMRLYEPTIPVGSVFVGSQVAKILESKNPDYPVGRHVVGYFGLRSHTISYGKGTERFPAPYLFPYYKDVPLSYFLGILGMPGCSAYFGFLEICHPKRGETVVVSGAAGSVGNIVGQIAKIKGCVVIGIAGSEEKGKWLVNELGFDHFINYKTDNLDKVLSQIAPQGIDCYFDTVGGKTTDIIINHMNRLGRISLCGSVSSYSEDAKVPVDLSFFRQKELKMEGFKILKWHSRFIECIEPHRKWLQEGKLNCKETVTEGFENMFPAFVEMLQGKHIGKVIVKV